MSLSAPLKSAFACLALGFAATGCFIATNDGSIVPAPSATPDEVSIDTGARLKVEGGTGAGLWVEYAGGGAWDVYTSCDTDISDRPCDFDVIVSAPGAAIAAPELHDHEPVDTLELRGDGSFRMVLGTAGKLGGVTFSVDPGAAIRIDMLLDGVAQPAFIHWVSGGAHVTGTDTTTNPLVFVPTSP